MIASSSSSLPPSRISHRAEGGPDLNYLYATNNSNNNNNDDNDDGAPTEYHQQHHQRIQRRGLRCDTRALRGTSLYLGGEEGPNQKIYCIPGHATRVLCINTITDEVYPIGPVFDANNMILNGKFKWLRGIVIGDIIFGLPCHADCVLRIDTKTDQVSTISIPYEEYFDDKIPRIEPPSEDAPTSLPASSSTTLAYQERHQPWKYHGGAISPQDGCIYAIPQTSRRVLRIDPTTEKCSFVGPELEGRCKWYGGVVGKTDGAIYGIPQNAGGVLRIDASGVVNCTNKSLSSSSSSSSPESRVLVTVHGSYPPGMHNWHGAAASSDGTIVCVPNNIDTVLCIVPALEAAYSPSLPYDADDHQKQQLVSPPEPELYILEGQSPSDIATGRHRTDGKYKYLGAMAGTDGHVYCFPSGSERVLQVDTGRRVARSVGPNLVGLERLSQNKWQNGLTSKQEGCVYAIPLAAETVLRIRTASAGKENQLLNDDDEPKISTWKLPQPSNVLAKWEGGVLATNGIIYCMPNNHKAVLQIVPPCVPSREALHRARDDEQKERERVREVQKQLRQQEAQLKKAEKEKKRQERIERKSNEKKKKSLEAKGLLGETDNDTNCGGTTSTIKEMRAIPSIKHDGANRVIRDEQFTPDGVPFMYTTGIPTLRSSSHRVKYSIDHREHNPNTKSHPGNSINTSFLPAKLCNEDVFSFSTDEYNFHDAVVDMLQRCDKTFVGSFRSLADGTTVVPTLDNFVVPPETLKRTCQHGQLESAQEYLSNSVASNSQFLSLFDKFVLEKVLPRLKGQLQACYLDEDNTVNRNGGLVTFYYQRPPTIRIQPGPARAMVRPHHDAEYGHQNGELNYWLPLTCRRKTGVDLWCESKSDAGDFHPVKVEYGQVAAFHGSSCRHYVNSNHSLWTRVSLDFRVGIEGYFDPEWQMNGTTNDHDRRKITL